MRIKIRNKHYDLEMPPRSKRRGHYGYCEAPNAPNKKIIVESGHPPLKEFEVLLHEILHAGFWDIDESVIREFSRDTARIFVQKLGWIRNACQDTPQKN